MRTSSRILMVAAALLLGVPFLRPLWHIALIAPQYPEGLGMYIWINQVTGEKEHDLQSINSLNHYIGMKEIIPEAIPELRFMPAIVAGLAVAALLVAVLRRRPLLYAWTAVYVVFALVGLADFWRWGYDYGHDLDPTAAIRVPGMAYQPPLIGSKQLLNFHATSWPAIGGWAAIAALVLAAIAAAGEWRRRSLPSPA
jgi:copper chaperone NosL